MISKPTNADQARQNAILAAETAEQQAGSRRAVNQPSTYASISRAWSAIATSFIESEMYASDPVLDDIKKDHEDITSENSSVRPMNESEKFEEWARVQIGKLNTLVQETMTRVTQLGYAGTTVEYPGAEKLTSVLLNNYERDKIQAIRDNRLTTITPQYYADLRAAASKWENSEAPKTGDGMPHFTIDEVTRAVVIRDMINQEEKDEPIIISTRDLRRFSKRSLRMMYNVQTGWELSLEPDLP